MNQSNYLFFPYAIARNCRKSLLSKMFVFGILVLILVSWFHKFKITERNNETKKYYDFDGYCEL
jgi:hypothetical protein